MVDATVQIKDSMSPSIGSNTFPAFAPESHWEPPHNVSTPYPAPLRIRTPPRKLSLLDRITRDHRNSAGVREIQDGNWLAQSSTEADLSSRPSTAMSDTPLRKTDPIEHIRGTLFGMRHRSNSRPSSRNSSSSPRPSSRQSLSRPASAVGQESFNTEEQYYHHQRQNSISRPFHFKHLKHTASQASLTTLSEKEVESANVGEVESADLSARPRAPSLPLHPLRHAVSMDHLSAHPNRSLARQAQVIAQVFGQYTNGSHAASTVNAMAESTDHEASSIHKHSKSSPHVNTPCAVNKPLPERPPRPTEAVPWEVFTMTPVNVDQSPSPQLDVVPEETTEMGPSNGLMYRERLHQRLPSLPASERVRSFASSSRSMSEGRRPASRSRTRSPAVSISNYSNDAGRKSGASWEDEVDLMYEQQAESTCDFDWTILDDLLETDDVPADASVVATPNNSRDAVISRPLQSGPRNPHQRGSSIGHLGFLAARQTSVVVTTSPSLSSAEADESKESGIVPFPSHLPYAGDLSDPESVRTGGANHRKSSSCGSFEASTRPPSATTGKGERWSDASSSSASIQPNTSHACLASSATDPTSSPVVDTEKALAVPKLRTDVPGDVTRSATSDFAPSEVFYMRRPQTSGERSVLQAAGRAVQRGRPLAAGRGARTAHGSSPSVALHPRVVAEEPTAWI